MKRFTEFKENRFLIALHSLGSVTISVLKLSSKEVKI